MKGGFKLKKSPEYNFLKELLFFLFDAVSFIFYFLKKLIDTFLEWIESKKNYDLVVSIICLLSLVLLFLLGKLHLYDDVVVNILIFCTLIPVLKSALELLSTFFEKVSNFFSELQYYLHYIKLAIKIIYSLKNVGFPRTISTNQCSYISIFISYYIVNYLCDNPNNRYALLYILIALFISLIIMVILSLFYNASILKRFKLKYEQTTVSFTIDFISGILFTLIIGLKTTLSNYFDKTLVIFYGKLISEQFVTEFGITIGDLITLMIYWFFALSLCFQIANRTTKLVINTSKNDKIESSNISD